MTSDAAYHRFRVLSALISLLLQLALASGAILAIRGRRAGAWLMLGAVIGFLVSHMVVGLIAYHRTMSRPWPKVPPLDEADD